MEDFTVLDQTTQNVSATVYRGKLGFQLREDSTLATAATLVIKTLEEYGHEVDGFHSKRAHRVTMDCDSYVVELRHRRTPSPLRQTNGEACRCQLDVLFRPRFPDHTDEEMTELLLARVMQMLLGELSATTVEWLDTGIVMDSATFLSAFADHLEAAPVVADIQTPIGVETAEPVMPARISAFDSYRKRIKRQERPAAPVKAPKSAARFADIDETFGSLERTCDRIIERRDSARDKELVAAYRKVTRAMLPRGTTPNRATAWVLTAVMAVISLPVGLTVAAVNLARGGDVRFSLQMLAATAALIVLYSSELVHAALR